MAEAKVGLSMTGAEYRFIRNELEIHANNLREQAKEVKMPKLKADLRKREAQLRASLKGM